MSDEELVKRLRSASKHPMMDNSCKADVFDVSEAADRIEALLNLNEALVELMDDRDSKLAKAMSIAKRVTSSENATEELAQCGCDRCKAHLDLRALLAEFEGEKT
jgi:hypothetical protein